MSTTTCPVCESKRLRTFLVRASVPVHQNRMMMSSQAARDMTRGELSLVCCESCGFIYNQKFDPAKLAYGAEYEAAQHYSAVFRQHVDGLAKHILMECAVRQSRIVEIGCGDAYFLHKLVDDPATGNTGIGFDPSYRGPDIDETGRLRFERRYFDDDCADLAADVVVCRHVIEHIPDPVASLSAVRQALQNSPHARIYYETPCVEWILAGNVIWDFFYEHCSYFSAQSLSTAFEKAGFRVERVKHVFGGQYLWLEAGVAENPNPIMANAGGIPDKASQFGIDEAQMLAALTQQFTTLAQQQKLAIWGAGAKGATLANLLDPGQPLFECVIDINPNKQNCYIGGTGHPIVSLEQAQQRDVSAALLMNPNYRVEIERMLQARGSPLELLEAG